MLLSLDIGFAKTGWAVFDFNEQLISFGIIKTEKTKQKNMYVAADNMNRVKELVLSLKEIIEKYQIKLVCAELPNGGAQSAQALAKMSMAASALMSLVTVLDIPIEWVMPHVVKKTISASHTVSKAEVMNTIKFLYPDAKFPSAKSNFEHIADAIAVFLTVKKCGVIYPIFKGKEVK